MYLGFRRFVLEPVWGTPQKIEGVAATVIRREVKSVAGRSMAFRRPTSNKSYLNHNWIWSSITIPWRVRGLAVILSFFPQSNSPSLYRASYMMLGNRWQTYVICWCWWYIMGQAQFNEYPWCISLSSWISVESYLLCAPASCDRNVSGAVRYSTNGIWLNENPMWRKK